MGKAKQIRHIILLFVLLSLVACKHANKVQERQAIPVDIQVVTPSTSNTTARQYVGKAAPVVSIPVSSAMGGVVEEIYVQAGQKVQQNDPILRLDTTQTAAAYRTARTLLNQAEDALQRAEQVHEAGGLSELNWQDLLTQVEKARNVFIAAEKQLNECTLRAPQAGIVSEMKLQVGEHLMPAIAATEIYNCEQMQVKIAIPETEISTISVGDNAQVIVAAINTIYTGKVTDKSLTANTLAHTYDITITVENDAKLLNGMLAKVTLNRDAEASIIIPQHLVETRPSGHCIWVVQDGKAKRQDIQIGNYTRSGIEIINGLQAGDTIITNGSHKLYTGAEITIK